MKYIKLFDSHTDYSDFAELEFIRPNVSHCIEDLHVHYNPILDPFNGHEYVDLGLPSGTLWATMNLGATSETDIGLYFAWGDTLGYATNTNFNLENYIFSPFDSNTGYTKYNITDNLMTLVPSDDAIVLLWGGNWRIPSPVLMEELFDNTQTSFVSNYNNSGVSGLIITGPNGNHIFTPVTYIQEEEDPEGSGQYYYNYYSEFWVNALVDEDKSSYAKEALFMYSDPNYTSTRLNNIERFNGLTLRGAIGNEVLTVNGYSNMTNFYYYSDYKNALGYDQTSNTFNLTLVLKEPINATEASFLIGTWNYKTSEYDPWISYPASSLDGGLTWTTQFPIVSVDSKMQLTLDNKSFMVVITNHGK